MSGGVSNRNVPYFLAEIKMSPYIAETIRQVAS